MLHCDRYCSTDVAAMSHVQIYPEASPNTSSSDVLALFPTLFVEWHPLIQICLQAYVILMFTAFNWKVPSKSELSKQGPMKSSLLCTQIHCCIAFCVHCCFPFHLFCFFFNRSNNHQLPSNNHHAPTTQFLYHQQCCHCSGMVECIKQPYPMC